MKLSAQLRSPNSVNVLRHQELLSDRALTCERRQAVKPTQARSSPGLVTAVGQEVFRVLDEKEQAGFGK
jgi:hypothetical protein